MKPRIAAKAQKPKRGDEFRIKTGYHREGSAQVIRVLARRGRTLTVMDHWDSGAVSDPRTFYDDDDSFPRIRMFWKLQPSPAPHGERATANPATGDRCSMEEGDSRRSWWAIEYVNGRQFIGRLYGHWTRGDLSTAELYDTPEAAQQALDALLAEGKDRLSKAKESWPLPLWGDVCGGFVVVTEIERILRRREIPLDDHA